MKVFIEFWKAKEAWKQLSKEERGAYVTKTGPVIQDLVAKGVTIDAWGMNDNTSPYRAKYDFYAVTKLPTQELLDSFQDVIEGAGWYDYFEQINMSGEDLGVEAVIGKMIDM